MHIFDSLIRYMRERMNKALATSCLTHIDSRAANTPECKYQLTEQIFNSTSLLGRVCTHIINSRYTQIESGLILINWHCISDIAHVFV